MIALKIYRGNCYSDWMDEYNCRRGNTPRCRFVELCEAQRVVVFSLFTASIFYNFDWALKINYLYIYLSIFYNCCFLVWFISFVTVPSPLKCKSQIRIIKPWFRLRCCIHRKLFLCTKLNQAFKGLKVTNKSIFVPKFGVKDSAVEMYNQAFWYNRVFTVEYRHPFLCSCVKH